MARDSLGASVKLLKALGKFSEEAISVAVLQNKIPQDELIGMLKPIFNTLNSVAAPNQNKKKPKSKKVSFGQRNL